jgi:hypothetical protein
MTTLLEEPPTGFVDDFGTSFDDDPPFIPDEQYDGGDGWKGPPDPIFLDLFLYYGSWFLLTYNGFFVTLGAAAWVLTP